MALINVSGLFILKNYMHLVPLLLTLFCQINYLRPMFQTILIFVINSGQLSETDKFTDNYQFYILKIINLHI